MKSDASFTRVLANRVPLFASVAGTLISMGSAAFFFAEDDFRRILGVTAGLYCLLLAVWYASHPFVKNERRNPALRGEVVKFVDLARELHYAAVRGDDDAFEAIKERVPAQANTVIDAARQSEAIDPTAGE